MAKIKLVLIALICSLSGCVEPGVQTPVPTPTPAPETMVALVWDGKNASSAEWTKTLSVEIEKTALLSANLADAADYCPSYGKLDSTAKKAFWMNLFAFISKYESNFNPKSSSVDVGSPNNKDTWSVGLFQMSVTDQKNYDLKTGFTYEDLQDGSKNIQLAVPVAARLILQDGRIGGKLANKWQGMTRYWAVMRIGSSSKYANDSAVAIKNATRGLLFCL